MGLIQNISNSVKDYFLSDYIKRKNLDYTLQDATGFWTASGFMPNSSNLKEDYSSFVYASVNCRAEKVRESSDFLYKRLANKKLKEIAEHPFLDLINKRNTYGQTFATIKYLISIGLDLYGDCFIYYPRNVFKMPAELLLLPSNRIKINYNSDCTQIVSYTLSGRAGNKTYSKDEILHIKLPNPESQFTGKATVSALRFQIDTDYYQSMYNKNFYLKDASVGGILKAPGKITDSNLERLTHQLSSKKSGYTNAGEWMVLQEGMDASRMNATPREAQFKDSRLNVRDEIFGVFKTSKSILGYTDDVNRSNAESARVSFIQNCIRPFAENISDAFDSFVKINYDERLIFKFDYDIEMDSAELRADLEFMTKYGILTKNEVREAKGYSPTVEGDSYYGEAQENNFDNQTDKENGNE